jgi:hypothetical protein
MTTSRTGWRWDLEGTVNPSAGGGVPGPIDTQYRNNTTGELFIKTGVSDTSWVLVATGSAVGFNFGDGSDGALVFDGVATVLGLVPVASLYTLLRDIFATTIAVSAGVNILSNGFRVYAKTSITGPGTIERIGNPGGVTFGGSGFTSRTLPGSASGGAENAAGLAGGVNAPRGYTGVGGHGGIGTGGGGLGGTTGATIPAATGDIRTAVEAMEAVCFSASTGITGVGSSAPGGGGGQSGGFSGSEGGGGGAGGGYVAVASPLIAGGLTVSAKGGTGGPGSAFGGFFGSGGGGGAGGIVVVVTNGALPAIDVSGGVGGTGSGGTSTAGLAGSAGLAITFTP